MLKELIKGRKKVLLVEDNEGDIFLYKTILKVLNAKIFNVDTVEKALKLLDKEKFDIVLLDLFLPDSEGIDTVKSILTKTDNVVVLTGSMDPLLKKEICQLGVKDFLRKGCIMAEKFIEILK